MPMICKPLVALFLTIACAAHAPAGEPDPPITLYGDSEYRAPYADLENTPAPPLHAEQWFNTPGLTMEDLRGRVVLLDFWGTWCAPCVKATNQLIRFHEIYADRGLTVLGVHTQAGKDKLEDYLQKKSVPYPVMIDEQNKTIKSYKVRQYPTFTLIDHTGAIRYLDLDCLDQGIARGNLERAVRHLLDEREEALGGAEPIRAWTGYTADVLPRIQALGAEGFSGYAYAEQAGVRLIESGQGMANRETESPWTAQTVSTVGSITKQFTAAAIMKLQEMGKLSVNDPIARYLPDVPEDKQSITIHHLLTHSAGIADLPVGDFQPLLRDEYVRRVLNSTLRSKPGETHHYANAGYSLLGAIIELVSGQSYEKFLRERLLLPAGMKDTGYLLPDYEPERLAQGYRDGSRWGTVLERPMADDGPYWALRANGGIHSTPRDMARWAHALLDAKVLSRESVEAMWTPHIREADDAPTWYGYGWVIMDLPSGARAIFHNGSNGIHYADCTIEPASRSFILVMTNNIDEFPAGRDLLRNMGDRLLQGPDQF